MILEQCTVDPVALFLGTFYWGLCFGTIKIFLPHQFLTLLHTAGWESDMQGEFSQGNTV